MPSPAEADINLRRDIADLARGLLDAAPEAGITPVSPCDLPEPFRKLLVHHDHMTATLAAHYGRPMTLRVLRAQLADGHYARHITLSPLGDPRVVEVGLVRIHLDSTPPVVRDMILRADTPLGDILTQQNVLRRIEPLAYVRLEPGAALTTPFGGSDAPVYGRVGVIHCDARPAIRLLEIVSGQ